MRESLDVPMVGAKALKRDLLAALPHRPTLSPAAATGAGPRPEDSPDRALSMLADQSREVDRWAITGLMMILGLLADRAT